MCLRYENSVSDRSVPLEKWVALTNHRTSLHSTGISTAFGWIKHGRWWLNFNMQEAPFVRFVRVEFLHPISFLRTGHFPLTIWYTATNKLQLGSCDPYFTKLL